MNNLPEEWFEAFRQHSKIFKDSFGVLTPAELNWKANDSTWSIGQVLDHLIRTNESYYPILDNVAAGANPVPWLAKLSFIPRFFGKFLLNSLEPERRKKIRTFPVWEPRQSAIPGDIVDQFTKHHEVLISRLQSHANLFGKGIIVSSPANKYVVYPLDTAVQIMLAHEQRHYNQAREVLAFQKGTQF